MDTTPLKQLIGHSAAREMRVPCAHIYTYFAGFEVLAGKSVNLCKHVNMYAHKTAGQDGWGNEISGACLVGGEA